ncbi:hypothetical protein GCM10025876_15570 [Demequina litorisediminis]|uniref:Uncharacterized protein n=1 Tax=Demequina litorisediminis TaxID=1849022 RepID=A0ABQ6IE24_9MICO|nr:hypothetical protein GCM10025876_15570 [Demequina litorisediminis]
MTPSSRASSTLATRWSLQFANDDIPTQSQQIDQMITNGAEALIIAAIDGTALASQAGRGCRGGHPRHRLRPPDP